MTVPPALVRSVSVRASGAVTTRLIAALAAGAPPGWCRVRDWLMPRVATTTTAAAARAPASRGTSGRPSGRRSDSRWAPC